MKPHFAKRFQMIQAKMSELDLDFLLVNNRENLIYFTGLTQIECMAILIPRQGQPCAITLWLDAQFVRQQTGLETYGYVFPQDNLADSLVRHIRAGGVEQPRIGFERYFVPFAVYDALRQAFPEQGFVNASPLFYQLRSVKDEQELALMKRAGQIVAAGMAAAVERVAAGVSELEVLAEAEYAMLKAGSGGSPFRPQVVSGTRTLLTHPLASEKLIQAGELVVIHLGAAYSGYCAKLCRTVAVGKVGAGRRAVYELLRQAQAAACQALKPGVSVDEVDRNAREIIREAGWEQHYLDVIGYGVGIRQSEFYPIIGKGRQDCIEAGMVVDLLLPTIYHPDVGGARITDCIYIGQSGNERITPYSQELIQK